MARPPRHSHRGRPPGTVVPPPRRGVERGDIREEALDTVRPPEVARQRGGAAPAEADGPRHERQLADDTAVARVDTPAPTGPVARRGTAFARHGLHPARRHDDVRAAGVDAHGREHRGHGERDIGGGVG